MLSQHSRFRPKSEEVAAKVMDGEAIIINLTNGIYYSTDGIGGLVWEMIEGGHNLEEIGSAVLARYEVSSKQAHADVERLISELIQEDLVVLSDGKTPRDEIQLERPSNRLSYESPELNIYRDMGDLLALDPPVPGLGDTPWKEPDDEF
jgi:hypothetical protein